MTFILNSHNVFDYLITQGLCNQSEQPPSKLELLPAKNFNLLLNFSDSRKLMVKQERQNQEGKVAGEFSSEWRIQEFLQRFPELDKYRLFLPEILHFDAKNSIIVSKYLDSYRDLMDFYTKEKSFPTEISKEIGTILGTIHRDTFYCEKYQEFFSNTLNNSRANQVAHLSSTLERVEPEIFGLVPHDGLKFLTLYQRYDSLGQAISQLGNTVICSCVTHNDLKLNNILLHNNWQNCTNNIIRLIDWERSAWGDPAFDLGTLIGSYMSIWLGSLLISNSLSIEESLRLAITPLELLQPSIGTLTQTYLNTFPKILEHRPDFLQRTVQFAGFALIQQIQGMIQYQKSFGNMGIATLQVAKALLCRPVQSMPTIFGDASVQLVRLSGSAV